jgi:DNA polymerase (family 10)
LADRHCRQAKEAGVRLVVDTDAHRADELGLMAFGVATARRGWIEPDDVINTQELGALMDGLGKDRKGN